MVVYWPNAPTQNDDLKLKPAQINPAFRLSKFSSGRNSAEGSRCRHSLESTTLMPPTESIGGARTNLISNFVETNSDIIHTFDFGLGTRHAVPRNTAGNSSTKWRSFSDHIN
ncbi:hypothetical protein KIN20_001986 [Parelaphostrongylus tenuis]|uniref:Uncharacterized protein n=1 Tax=Parelaphostrongylus tenuis TaxID=148309 RepID=A0AAD5LZ69_PARTN|nr:hypothetical protein KIN20_001986 [Parelaphostrongylus tenuis]